MHISDLFRTVIAPLALIVWIYIGLTKPDVFKIKNKFIIWLSGLLILFLTNVYAVTYYVCLAAFNAS